MSKRVLAGVGLLLLITIALVIGSWCMRARPYYSWVLLYGSLPFDQQQWRDPDPYCIRGRMFWSLLREYDLIGMTRSEIIGLLGMPDWADWRSGPHRVSESVIDETQEFDYELGICDLIQLEMDFLAVCFGEDGKVARWMIFQSGSRR